MQKKLNFYINFFKQINRFEFIKWNVELKNALYLFSAYVSFLYYEEVLEMKNDDELLEIKTHSAFIYLGSIIEAVFFYFVEEKLKNDEKSKRKYLEIEEYKKVQDLKKCENLYICELIKKEVNFNNSINFNALINWAKDKKLVDEKIIERINSFRKMRNRIHINVYKSWKLIVLDELEKAFIETKEILDYLEDNIEECK